ncbi:MAG: hypothetical protein K2G36_07220 [Ruminococcus sp.]|nr:hypothetical protein [Ruminococcus sp.]
MEELIVYGIFADLGSQSENLYQKKLDMLFLENPDNKHLLQLELLSGNILESIIYMTNHIHLNDIQTESFKRNLAEYLKKLYYEMDIDYFCGLCYKIWNFRLPESIRNDEYFDVLSYVYDGSWLGWEYARKNLEKLFSHYG